MRRQSGPAAPTQGLRRQPRARGANPGPAAPTQGPRQQASAARATVPAARPGARPRGSRQGRLPVVGVRSTCQALARARPMPLSACSRQVPLLEWRRRMPGDVLEVRGGSGRAAAARAMGPQASRAAPKITPLRGWAERAGSRRPAGPDPRPEGRGYGLKALPGLHTPGYGIRGLSLWPLPAPTRAGGQRGQGRAPAGAPPPGARRVAGPRAQQEGWWLRGVAEGGGCYRAKGGRGRRETSLGGGGETEGWDVRGGGVDCAD
jgi:hypothetical protein